MAKPIKEKKEPILYKEWLQSAWTQKLLANLESMSRVPNVHEHNLSQVSTYIVAYLQAVQKIKDDIKTLDMEHKQVVQKPSHYDAMEVLRGQGLWSDAEMKRMIKAMEEGEQQ